MIFDEEIFFREREGRVELNVIRESTRLINGNKFLLSERVVSKTRNGVTGKGVTA